MNRQLLVIAIFLFLVGLAVNPILSILGLLLAFPALLSPSRPPTSRPQTKVGPQPRRITPKIRTEQPQTPSQPIQSSAPPLDKIELPPSRPSSPTSYPPALFPNAMFPSLALAPSQKNISSGNEVPPGPRDEVVEIGAILALLSIVFG